MEPPRPVVSLPERQTAPSAPNDEVILYSQVWMVVGCNEHKTCSNLVSAPSQLRELVWCPDRDRWIRRHTPIFMPGIIPQFGEPGVFHMTVKKSHVNTSWRQLRGAGPDIGTGGITAMAGDASARHGTSGVVTSLLRIGSSCGNRSPQILTGSVRFPRPAIRPDAIRKHRR